MGAYATTGTGIITAGEQQIIIRPSNQRGARYGVLYTHGAGSGPDALMDYGGAGGRTQALADGGLTAVSADFGGPQTWGNDKAMTALTAAYNWLQTQPGVKPGKVILSGGSMGGLNALVWAAANPGKVACLSIYIPVLDVNGIHADNLGGYRATIDSCYTGGWNPTAMAATKDPLTMAKAGKFAGMPIRLYHGLRDPLCLATKAKEFAAAVGPNVIRTELAYGHEERSESQIDRVVESEWILSYAK